MIKPKAFNYQKYLEALKEIDRLKKANANLQIHCRILENDLKMLRDKPADCADNGSGDS